MGVSLEQLGKSSLVAYYKDDQERADAVQSQNEIWSGKGHFVSSFRDLLSKLAELHYLNPDFVLMLRGQSRDYKHRRGHSFLKPGIFRSQDGEYPGNNVLKNRFERLRFAEKALVGNSRACLVNDPKERISRYRIIRWAILQHYGVVETPLLDVTTSVRVAASFASVDAKDEAYLFVLAVPNVSSAVTSSADAGVQVIRLSSVCPPSAMRPHVQEGYLLGEYPEIDSFEQKKNYAYGETDFGHRLISKFRFDPRKFWHSQYFPKVPPQFLYPSEQDDPFLEFIEHVKRDLESFPNLPQVRYHIGDGVFEITRRQ